jgi:hypothetical protein
MVSELYSNNGALIYFGFNNRTYAVGIFAFGRAVLLPLRRGDFFVEAKKKSPQKE